MRDAPDLPNLEALEGHDEFHARHIGPNEGEVAAMLSAIDASSLEALIAETVPDAIQLKAPLALPGPVTEREALAMLRDMASQNRVAVSLIGQGYYGTITPSVILRNVLENPGWYTAYTPYQAEIAQGRLEGLLNFQQMVVDLTGLELANASLLDEATAAAEAMTLCRRMSKSKAAAFHVDADTHPQTIAVLRTRAEPMGIAVEVGDVATLDPSRCFGALLSYPGSSGQVRDWCATIEALHGEGALAVMATDLLALALLTPPGELGADIAVGSAQRFGVPMGFGGPHAAFFATREAYKRSCPGRIIGVSSDAHGAPALRMALQTREQHIRRDKATSNICTAQALLAIMASMYAVYHGPEGISRIARRVARLTGIAAEGLRRLGVTVETTAYFDTITVSVPGRAVAIADAAAANGLNFRRVDADRLGMSFDETTTRATLRQLWACFDEDATFTVEALDLESVTGLPDNLTRTSAFLTHPIFNTHHAETEMMRYLRRLQGRDLALDQAMIPLGSCTMKLNAATEMKPITLPGFADIHPFAPADQTAGYRRLIDEVEAQLRAITGFAAVSLQPNAGSQGEYAGLLAIRRWQLARGEAARDVCLIPVSAHGTNPASAIMAGMRVVLVACDGDGNVDLADLAAKIETHGAALAALMVTYPSTHGVFEAGIVDICRMVHDAGGQVYMDGANLNAMVGLSRPADIGADVCHMNLHKTFCIPHGGGGPGVGPIGVAAHLAPFLPGDPADSSAGAVSAAPHGSALILPISWAYITMMGADGLRRATEVAILSANYIAARLDPFFPVAFKGGNGRVAHECIIDMRGIKAETGIGVEDVAKRLMDYGFHAPTMSWPVAETMMIEPTESESLAEIDRFCDAMIAIRAEIAEIAEGKTDAQDNLLRAAPHAQALLMQPWTRPYDMARAFYPGGRGAADKFWPAVGRIDNVAGDRQLVCTCPPVEAYAQAAE